MRPLNWLVAWALSLTLVASFAVGDSFAPRAIIGSGTTVIAGGADQEVCFNDAGKLACGDAGLTYNKTTDTLTSGPISGTVVTATTRFNATGTTTSTSAANSADYLGNSIVFEGSTANAFETTIAITNPTTTDKTITVPDATLTLNAAADISGTTLAANVVTSSLTTVGALGAGSITSGFGTIDVGADSVSGGTLLSQTATGGLVLTSAGGAAANPATNEARLYTREDIDQGSGTATADCAIVARLSSAAEVLVQVLVSDGGCP